MAFPIAAAIAAVGQAAASGGPASGLPEDLSTHISQGPVFIGGNGTPAWADVFDDPGVFGGPVSANFKAGSGTVAVAIGGAVILLLILTKRRK